MVDNSNKNSMSGDEVINAIWYNNLVKLKKLIDQNPDLVNYDDSLTYSPLIHAAFCGRTKIAKYLIDHGAKVNAKYDSGYTPMRAAFESGFYITALTLATYSLKEFLFSPKTRCAATFAIAVTASVAVCALGFGVKSGAIKINSNVISSMLESIGKAADLSR